MALGKHWSRNLTSRTCHLRICRRSNFAKSTSKGYWKHARFIIMIFFRKKAALVYFSYLTLQTRMAMEILEKKYSTNSIYPSSAWLAMHNPFDHRTTPRTRPNNSQEQNGNSTSRMSASRSHYHRSGQKWVIACWVLVARTGTCVRSWKEIQLIIDSFRICQQLLDSKSISVTEKIFIDSPRLEHALHGVYQPWLWFCILIMVFQDWQHWPFHLPTHHFQHRLVKYPMIS